MEEKKKVPILRFPGFTDEWEQRKLSEIYGTIRNAFVGTATPYYVDEGHFYLESNNVKDGSINKNSQIFINDEFYNKQRDKWLHTGDIVMVQSGHVGHSAVIPESLDNTAAHALIMFQNQKVETDPYFLNAEYQTDEAKRQIDDITKGNTIKHILASDMHNFLVDVPSLPEQHKIACFFQDLDNLITLHQRQLDNLKEFKKGCLQKMFPRDGETKPELRFPGFTDDWEQRKFGDLIIEYKETVDSNCTLPILTSSKTEGVVLQEEHFGRKQKHDINGYNILPRNYCTYRNRSDGIDFTFNINKCCDKGIISKFYPVFYGDGNDTFFISLVLNNSEDVVREIGFTCTGTGQKVLAFADLQNMKIPVPSYAEQKRISDFFDSLDRLITLHQREIDELNQFKKGMLQQMFV